MGKLTPEQHSDRNDKTVTRWIGKMGIKKKRGESPLVPLTLPVEESFSYIDALSNAIPSHPANVSKVSEFLTKENLDKGFTDSSIDSYSAFLSKMTERTLNRVIDFMEDKENGKISRHMSAAVLGSLAKKYHGRSSDSGISYVHLNNMLLLSEDFYRSCPSESILPVESNPTSAGIMNLSTRFMYLMEAIKPQNLSYVPDFSTFTPRDLQRTRAALVIANVFYTGASDKGSRHRESELLDSVEKYFDRRFEIVDVFQRYSDATPRVIDDMMTIDTRSLREGWL